MENLGLIILITFFVIFIFALLFIRPKQDEWKKEAQNKLNKIIRKQSTADPKILLIEMDKLLDFCLKESKVEGETLAERLKKSKNLFEWDLYQNIWEAHKTRNKLVHEIDFQISEKEVKKHYEMFKKGIKELIR